MNVTSVVLTASTGGRWCNSDTHGCEEDGQEQQCEGGQVRDQPTRCGGRGGQTWQVFSVGDSDALHGRNQGADRPPAAGDGLYRFSTYAGSEVASPGSSVRPAAGGIAIGLGLAWSTIRCRLHRRESQNRQRDSGMSNDQSNKRWQSNDESTTLGGPAAGATKAPTLPAAVDRATSRPNWTGCGFGRRRTPGKAMRSLRPDAPTHGRGNATALIGPRRAAHPARSV